MSIQMNENDGQTQVACAGAISQRPRYPVDLSSYLALSPGTSDATGVPYHGDSSQYHPTIIAHYALAHWNQYLTANDEHHRSAFLTQARWFVEHEVRISDDGGIWPVSLPHPDVRGGGSWLSATAQGGALSVLVRAFQLTGEDTFLSLAGRAARSFERDILDGGLSTPVGEDGIFFEEVAAYPATHTLGGCVFALCGLYDYVALTDDTQIERLIQRSLATMHVLLGEFDVGFWTRADLLHRRLASEAQLTLQAELLEALVTHSGCQHCSELASRWKGYQRDLGSRLRSGVARRCASYNRALWSRVRSMLFQQPWPARLLRVCVPIHAFPVTGGTRAVLAGVAQVTADQWQLEYLTQHAGPNPDGLIIHEFGSAKTAPWQFPMVWLYSLAGWWKLTSLIRNGCDFHVVLPQDGVFTSAFAALAAKLAGVRVVCVDHGNLTLLKDPSYRAERIAALATKKWSWPRRLLARLRYMGYWPSLSLLARISARFVDHYLIPGVVDDGTEEICKRLGVPASRITRFGSMIDTHRYSALDATARASARGKYGIAADSIVVAMTCRLAPEKGLDVALHAIGWALSELSPGVHARVRVIIAGDGPSRAQVEETIHNCGLSRTCALWGETSTTDVISLLGMSDIFLYTSVRGACLSMAVLEAMASGCAVVASTRPLSNARLLAEGRGIAVPAGDVEQTGGALARLVNDGELCHIMGRAARDYVSVHHSAAVFRRVLTRATYWSHLNELLDR